jgi:hypothetical protein
MGLTRRDVLILGSSGAAAAAANFVDTVTPATAQTAALPQSWDREADIVVIGSGAAGFQLRLLRVRPAPQLL